MFTWLVKHAQFLLNNFAIQSDGLTPFERRWSKRYTSALGKFGEIVLCKLRGKQPKADPSWVPGLWLGRNTSADMHVVGTTSGVFQTRSIRRLPVSEQVDKQLLKDFQAKPWDPKGRGEDTGYTSSSTGSPRTSTVDSSQHGLKRTSDELGDEAQEDEPPNLFQRVGPLSQGARQNFNGFLPCLKTIHFLSLVLALLRFPPRVDLTFQLSPMLTEKKNFKHFAQQIPYFGTTPSLTASKRLQE